MKYSFIFAAIVAAQTVIAADPRPVYNYLARTSTAAYKAIPTPHPHGYKASERDDYMAFMPEEPVEYVQYRGNGSVEAGWPTSKMWLPFKTLFKLSLPLLKKTNSEAENKAMYYSILRVANETGVPAELIWVNIMQESRGNVTVHATTSPAPWNIRNPGLMQCHEGKASCEGMSYCPANIIYEMIREGTNGTAAVEGDGIKQYLKQAEDYGADGAHASYVAARLYNSGKYSCPGGTCDLGKGGATSCYASDIANRLLGWIGDGPCTKESL